MSMTFEQLKEKSKNLRLQVMKSHLSADIFASSEVVSVISGAMTEAKKQLREPTDEDMMNSARKNLKGVNEMLKLLPVGDIRIDEFTVRQTTLIDILPTMMTEHQLEDTIVDVIFRGMEGVRNKGSILKTLKAQFGGKYDNKMASDLVTKILSD